MCVCVSHSVMSYSLWLMDCSLPGSSVHGILQARIMEWAVIPFSKGSSRPRVSYIAGRFFTIWATRKAHWVLISLSKQISCRRWGWSYECKVYTEEWVIITQVVSYIHLLSPRVLCLKKKWIQVAPRFWNYFLSYFTSLLFFMQLKYH